MQEYIHYFLYGFLLILPFLFIYKMEKNKWKRYKKLFFTYVILFWFLYLFMIIQIGSYLNEKMNLIDSKYRNNHFSYIEKKEYIKCPNEKYELYIDRERCIQNIRKNYKKEEIEYLSLKDRKYWDWWRNAFALLFWWLIWIIYFYIIKVFIIFLVEIYLFIQFLYKKLNNKNL